MTDMTIPEALDKLAAEGDADHIADFLRTHGHFGVWSADMAVSTTCPIARYLHANGAPGARVYGATWGGDRVRGWLPEPISDFVNNFDLGHYPELIERADDA